MSLWSSKQAASATGGKAVGDWQANGVSIDSRNIGKGDLFIALKGENFDGHDFAAKALENGAAAVVVSRIPPGVPEKSPLLIVKDVTSALWQLGEESRRRTKARIVGVTGSVGKTGTKELTKLVLESFGKTYATVGNLNNHFGAPLSLSRMPEDTEYGVFEMGMNHSGEISQLTGLIKPDVAIITTVEPVHLEFFKSVEEIAKAKSEIFEGVVKGGTAILNIDNPNYQIMKEAAAERNLKIISFGEAEKADFRLLSYNDLKNGIRVKAVSEGKEFEYELSVSGKHWAMNSLGVLAIVKGLGFDINKALPVLKNYTPAKGRGQIFKIDVGTKKATLIDDSYNASPASMRAGFEVLAKHKTGGRAVALLGDMRELGSSAPELHSGLAKDIIARGIDKVFTAGDLMHNLFEALPENKRGKHFKNAAEMAESISREISEGDVLLVKGSNGSRMFDVVSKLKNEKDNSH